VINAIKANIPLCPFAMVCPFAMANIVADFRRMKSEDAPGANSASKDFRIAYRVQPKIRAQQIPPLASREGQHSASSPGSFENAILNFERTPNPNSFNSPHNQILQKRSIVRLWQSGSDADRLQTFELETFELGPMGTLLVERFAPSRAAWIVPPAIASSDRARLSKCRPRSAAVKP
jgi:hypothetical protein